MELGNPPPQLHSKSLQLPQEIIEVILAMLPVKSLLKFKCVSKAWRRLIGSDRFVKIQLQKSRDDRSFVHWRVIFSNEVAGLKQCSMGAYNDDETPVDPYPLEGPTNYEHPISGGVVSSINGVVCIRMKSGCFSLYNPSTRILRKLPKLDKAIPKCGFAWDETTDAYKVFAVMLECHYNRIGQLYSSKTNSWKTVAQASSLFGRNPYGVSAGGKIHWLGEGRQHVEFFDLKSELFEVTEVPFKPEAEASVCVWETRGYIGMVVDSKKGNLIDIWIMKEYGVKESWVKEVRRLPQRKITNCYRAHFHIDSLVSPVFDKQKEVVEEEPEEA